MSQQRDSVQVWDRFQRIGHWALVAAFVVAYATAEEVEGVHIAAGFVAGACVVSRLLWGFIGSANARFASFVRRPRAVFAYLAGLFSGKAPRYLGHNPAGGAMVVALLAALAATVASGVALWTAPEFAEEALEEVHEFFANFTLTLIALHLAGVLASSLAHRENLPAAMVTGRKRAPEEADSGVKPAAQPALPKLQH